MRCFSAKVYSYLEKSISNSSQVKFDPVNLATSHPDGPYVDVFLFLAPVGPYERDTNHSKHF